MILVVGLALRLIIAYVLLPGSGFGVDRGTFQAWAGELAAHGPYGFYDRGFFVDYTPGYLYVLWLIGLVGQAARRDRRPDQAAGDPRRRRPRLARQLVRRASWADRVGPALIGAILVLVNPVTWFDSAIWGQVDSFGVIFLLLAPARPVARPPGAGVVLRGRSRPSSSPSSGS